MTNWGFFKLPNNGEAITQKGFGMVLRSMTWRDLEEIASSLDEIRSGGAKRSAIRLSGHHFQALIERLL